MLASFYSSLKTLSVGGRTDRVDSEQDEEEDETCDDIEIPMVRTGISANRNPATLSSETSSDERDPELVEVKRDTGIITALDFSMRKGVIDRMYQFDVDKFCTGNNNFDKGVKVEYMAQRSRECPQWQVTSMELFESVTEKVNKERSRFRTVIAQVKKIIPDTNDIEVEVGKDKNNARLVKIPNDPDLDVGFLWMPGDWVQISLEAMPADGSGSDGNDDLSPSSITRSKIKSLAPLHKKTLVGKVTKRRHNFLIDNDVYYTEELCNNFYPVGTTVRCIAIQSTQYIGDDFVNWRAIEVKKSNFLHYTCPEALANTEGVGEGDWHPETSEQDAVLKYKELQRDKFGVHIQPRIYLNFPASLIGLSATKNLTVRNNSTQSFRLKQIVLWQHDDSDGQFKFRSPQQEPDGGLTLMPDDEVRFDVICCPSKIGKTKEIYVFDFGHFRISREFTCTGFSPEERLLRTDNTAQRPNFKKQIGEQDISKIIHDRERRRVRGSQIIRAPFFAQKRLPLNKVPNELYQIMKTQDESELRRLYPNALQTLQYSNYLQKFRVSLWFEEIENDLRRRQYDLRNVRLKKHVGTPVYYTFSCPGILDFQPPVNLQDTIDAFDEENTKNAKFQGTITKISDTEVTCVFGDAFNELYTGFPLSIQFNLGRTNYKRCHFAIQTAVEHLGKDFLFPEDDVIIKTPRISIFEETTIDGDAEVVEQKDNQNSNDDIPFRKATPSGIFRSSKGSSATPNSSQVLSPVNINEVVTGRRVPSLRSRFVSNTPSAPSSSIAKLQWFNTSLNQEQKNAVRRILSGQARPLPYVIFGPPGTGKTVTLVEAVMQVNKLDKNSRILVCAPSNAAADVIAEYLANSSQYNPGDFIRLNGFLRAEQTMLDTVSPFCLNGDDLARVAMHRLIISTCMTAGQFFSLDLTLGHFTHVFIDEAGYCTEPEAMVPTILLAKSKGGQLILAGDPNQLGPVLMSDVSQNCGLNRSFLERLMSRQLYMRDPDRFPTEKYNPLVLTKLVKNYRAHHVLLSLPSRLFYDDDLIAHAPEEVYELCQDHKMKEILVSEGVPLIFEGVQGTCIRERDSPSWCNIPEAMKVAYYVNALVRKCGLSCEDIGIITPYRKQVEKIRTALQLNLKDIDIPKVASVEEFQGGERKVIIISTVRSVNEDKIDSCLERLGFLYQPKRFNVVITRAKALMIVVGNPHVLAKNNFWLQLLRYAIELNAYRGCNLPIHLNDKVRKLVIEESHEEADLKESKPESAEQNGTIMKDAHDDFKDCDDEAF